MVEATGMDSLTYICIASSLLLSGFPHLPYSGKDSASKGTASLKV